MHLYAVIIHAVRRKKDASDASDETAFVVAQDASFGTEKIFEDSQVGPEIRHSGHAALACPQ